MPLDVPEDVLYVLCDRLAEAKDFDTLFQCALTGKRFAVPALTTLYRYISITIPSFRPARPDSPQAPQCLSCHWRRRRQRQSARSRAASGPEMVDNVAFHHRIQPRSNRISLLPLCQDSRLARPELSA